MHMHMHIFAGYGWNRRHRCNGILLHRTAANAQCKICTLFANPALHDDIVMWKSTPMDQYDRTFCACIYRFWIEFRQCVEIGEVSIRSEIPRHSSSTHPESELDSNCQGAAETTSNTSPAYEPQTWTQEFADLQGRVNRYHGYTHRVFKIPHRGGLEADGQPSPTARSRVNLKAPSPVSPSAKLSVKGGEQGAELASPRQEGVQ